MTVIFKKPSPGCRMLEMFICEFIGSAITMCFGCLGLYVDADRYVDIEIFQAALVWGLIVCPISIGVGYISGGQCNPCVTLCFLILGDMSFLDALTYACLVAQFLGHMFGMTLAVILVPRRLYREYDAHLHCGFCSTAPGPEVSVIHVFLLEFWATFVLILYVCGASDPRTDDMKDVKPLTFAFLMAMFTISVGPFTGNSSNPFRSFAPAVFSNCWEDHYAYWFGPLSGSASASLLYKYILKRPTDHYHPYELAPTTLMSAVPAKVETQCNMGDEIEDEQLQSHTYVEEGCHLRHNGIAGENDTR